MDTFEFEEAIKILESINDNELILEEVVDDDRGFKKRRQNAHENTKTAMKYGSQAFGAVVDIKSAEYKTAFTLFNKILQAIAKAAVNIAFAIDDGMKKASNTMYDLKHIPGEVLSKLNGNLSLYFTVRDLQMIYSQSVIVKINTILTTLEPLVKTKNKEWKDGGLLAVFSSTVKGDVKALDKIHTMVENFENIKFGTTTIEMKDLDNVNLYLSPDANITVTMANGKKFTGSYIECLNKLLEDINTKSSILKYMENVIGNKYSNGLENGSYAKLSQSHQKIVEQGIRDIGKMIRLVAEITKCVNSDISTVNKASTKIIKYYKKAGKK